MQWYSWRTCTVRAAGANFKCRRHELLGAGLWIEAGSRLSSHIAPASASQVPAQKKYTLSKIMFSFSWSKCLLSPTCRSFKPQNFLNENAWYPIIRELGSTITIAISVSGVRFTFKVNCVILHALVRAKLKMADACMQTHSSQAGDN